MNEKLKHPPVTLNDEELRILALLASGRGTDVMAKELDVSSRTVRRRLRRVCAQLGVATPIEAVTYAAREGLILAGPPRARHVDNGTVSHRSER